MKNDDFFDPLTLSVSARRKKLKAHLSRCHAREGSVFGSAPGVFVRIPHPKPHRVCTFIKRLICRPNVEETIGHVERPRFQELGEVNTWCPIPVGK